MHALGTWPLAGARGLCMHVMGSVHILCAAVMWRLTSSGGVTQFHWAPTLGAKYMTDEEAQLVGYKNMRHRCAPPPPPHTHAGHPPGGTLACVRACLLRI